jgi:hypothetical protein
MVKGEERKLERSAVEEGKRFARYFPTHNGDQLDPCHVELQGRFETRTL